MLIYPGGPAESLFRLKKRLSAIQRRVPSVSKLVGQFVYLADIERILTPNETSVLKDILGFSCSDLLTDVSTVHLITVIPRQGTVSPWSTKATDILERCKLSAVRRIERGIRWQIDGASSTEINDIVSFLYDPMTEAVIIDDTKLGDIFSRAEPASLRWVKILTDGIDALEIVNQEFGFALSEKEIAYLVQGFRALGRNPSDAELMMFAQVNSEHCRHKLFNSKLIVDDSRTNVSLFQLIKSTQEGKDNGTLVAYRDNAAVVSAEGKSWFLPHPHSSEYGYIQEPVYMIVKVETHNHPTGISPFPGAATGSGGEIRDEGATGRGGWPKAGITGFSVSNLRIPGAHRAWEEPMCSPHWLATPLRIMIDGPVGAASYNNEFGRPNIAGYFRTLEISETCESVERRRGYHKPIMLAGGLGSIRSSHIHKQNLPAGAKLIVLGGPGMLIGLGGGAASSLNSGTSSEFVDFASVQRDNPEMQRRCQEVINHCIALGDRNPILSIHDVGAGGLCNALPELVRDSSRGGDISLRDIPNDDPSMSPMEIWCNESQERYVIALSADRLKEFALICDRERCPYAVVGQVIENPSFLVRDNKDSEKTLEAGLSDQFPVDLDMNFLFGSPPQGYKQCRRRTYKYTPLDFSDVDLGDGIERILRLPGVADKSFLINICDRSVGGRISRDQMVGPWQVPVADVGVTSSGFIGQEGEALSIGERSPIALLDSASSARIAVGEAITNIAAASVRDLSAIKLSANWMAAAGHEEEAAELFDAVKAATQDICLPLGLSIPVGKDSLSMAVQWKENRKNHEVISPLSLVVTAFAPVHDVRLTWTPVLQDRDESLLLFIDLSLGKRRLGGSALAQVYGLVGSRPPDVESVAVLEQFFIATRELVNTGQVLAYHDRSDGGLFVTIAEMAFSGRRGVELDIGSEDPLEMLFNEELGAVFQIDRSEAESVFDLLKAHGLETQTRQIGVVVSHHEDILIKSENTILYRRSIQELHRVWSETTWQIETLRDDPDCAKESYDRLLDRSDPGLHAKITYDFRNSILQTTTPGKRAINVGARPKVGILREQGINGHVEMAAAFDTVGFSTIDVTMTDLSNRHKDLADFCGIVACGGFSYGDVFGAGVGWAKSILHQAFLRDAFLSFFNRQDTFALGVCNGCQMFSELQELIPGAEGWPRFIRNRSDQFESRFVMIEIAKSKSMLFSDMEGSRLPIVVAHGEGQVDFKEAGDHDRVSRGEKVCMRYVDNYGQNTQQYPSNPNGSVDGLTAFCNEDGRVAIMMPHPERVIRTMNCSWHPRDWLEFSPWLKMFRNARKFCS